MMRRSFAGTVIKEEFRKAFHEPGGNDEQKLSFIRIYLDLYEEFQDTLKTYYFVNNAILDHDPLEDEENEINLECIEFLIRKIGEEKEYTNTKATNKGICLPAFLEYSHKGYAFGLIGLVYELGAFNVPKNARRAFYSYYSARKLEDGFGIYRYGLLALKGIAIKQNTRKGTDHFRWAMKKGDPQAIHIYGIAARDHIWDVYDEYGCQIIDYFDVGCRLADKAYPYACFDRAKYLEKMITHYDREKETAKAYRCYEVGASLGCVNCLSRLGDVYENGELDKEPDVKLMLSYHEKSASMFGVDSMFRMALQYYSGNMPYLEKNVMKAYELAMRAAMFGDVRAIVLIIAILEKGLLFERDPIILLWWCKFAEGLGYTDVNVKIKLLLEEIRAEVMNR